MIAEACRVAELEAEVARLQRLWAFSKLRAKVQKRELRTWRQVVDTIHALTSPEPFLPKHWRRMKPKLGL